ncbi:hypothetical protein E3N88_10032 [Mikania micrantha]|uniref:Uncharacterized protein n=1 Tax=Mikania micrantha TaxID=192012 RepID=A0A5N6P9B8_9ASTR|nr:hypothetical protein E3N88_10032 [Mikania micrantha]
MRSGKVVNSDMQKLQEVQEAVEYLLQGSWFLKKVSITHKLSQRSTTLIANSEMKQLKEDEGISSYDSTDDEELSCDSLVVPILT